MGASDPDHQLSLALLQSRIEMLEFKLENVSLGDVLDKINLNKMSTSELRTLCEAAGDIISRSMKVISDREIDQTSCKICYGGEAVFVLYPCGHSSLCSNCAAQLTSKQCPFCRTMVTETIRTYN